MPNTGVCLAYIVFCFGYNQDGELEVLPKKFFQI